MIGRTSGTLVDPLANGSQRPQADHAKSSDSFGDVKMTLPKLRVEANPTVAVSARTTMTLGGIEESLSTELAL